MSKAKEILDHYLKLIEQERQEERRLYRERFLETPIEVRQKKGLTWYPVYLGEVKVGLGDRLIAEIERSSPSSNPGIFQVGSIASLWSNADPRAKHKPFLTGVITKSGESSIHIALDVDELPDWTDDEHLGLDLYYDERTFDEMAKALKAVRDARGDRTAELRDILFGEAQPYAYPSPSTVVLPSLNASQNQALQLVDRAHDLAILHGPPGTGKTHTLIRTIVHTLKSESQVLVCAASNLAVDLLVERLAEEGVNVVRLGHPARISEIVLKQSLDVRAAIHPAHKDIKHLRREADRTRKQALKFKRTFGREQRQQRKAMLWEARELQREAKRLERNIISEVLDRAQVIACTLAGAAGSLMERRHFKTLFMDEGAQAMLPAALIPLLKADRVVFAGDHCQLPPTVKSREAARDGLAESLFERAIRLHPEAATMLQTQYRMHEQIMGFSSAQFYAGELQAAPEVASWTMDQGKGEALLAQPLHFVDTAGCGYEEFLNPESLSTSNPGEADLVLRHISKLLALLPKPDPEDLEAAPSIGIISPYKDQVKLLRREAQDTKALWPWLKRISIDTVDGFQGQERDIIYISLVRSNPQGVIGFLSDTRRMNVALTRARKKLVVVGDSATLAGHAFYQAFLDYVDSVEAYTSAWEFME